MTSNIHFKNHQAIVRSPVTGDTFKIKTTDVKVAGK
jgi:ribosomal protein L31